MESNVLLLKSFGGRWRFFFSIKSQKVFLLNFFPVLLLLVLLGEGILSIFVLIGVRRNSSALGAIVPLHGFPCSLGYDKADGWTERMVKNQFLKLCMCLDGILLVKNWSTEHILTFNSNAEIV